MDAPPLPTKPEPPDKPRSTCLAIILMASGGLAAAVVLTFLTLGFFGPIFLLGLAVFGVIGLQYLVWGWWFERMYRGPADPESRGPGDPERGRPDVIALGHQRVLHRPRTQPPVGGCEQHGQSGSLAMRTVRKAGANAS